MKSLAFCISILLTMLFSINRAEATTHITIPANTHVHIGPCNYTVTGWVEISLFPRKLEHCDVKLSGPCGEIRMQQRESTPVDPNPEVQLTDEYGNIIDDAIMKQEILDYLDSQLGEWCDC